MIRKRKRTPQSTEEPESLIKVPARVPEKRTVAWRAIFIGEKGRSTTAVELDGQQYLRGEAILVNQITKERLEKLDNLRFEFQEV